MVDSRDVVVRPFSFKQKYMELTFWDCDVTSEEMCNHVQSCGLRLSCLKAGVSMWKCWNFHDVVVHRIVYDAGAGRRVSIEGEGKYDLVGEDGKIRWCPSIDEVYFPRRVWKEICDVRDGSQVYGGLVEPVVEVVSVFRSIMK